LNACLALHRVEWPRSYAAADGVRMLCWYRARDAESVRLVLRQLGSTGTAVWPVATSDDPSVEPLGGAVQRVVAELAFDAPADAARLERAKESVGAALVEAGHGLVRAFAAPASARLVCVIDGSAHCVCCCKPRVTSTAARCPALDLGHRHLRSSASIDAPRAMVALAGASAYQTVIIGAGLGGICALERLVHGTAFRCMKRRATSAAWRGTAIPARVWTRTYTYGYSFPMCWYDWDGASSSAAVGVGAPAPRRRSVDGAGTCVRDARRGRRTTRTSAVADRRKPRRPCARAVSHRRDGSLSRRAAGPESTSSRRELSHEPMATEPVGLAGSGCQHQCNRRG
jgi:hypothetical protein